MLSLSACNGILEDIYDAPEPEDSKIYGFIAIDNATHTGRIYIDATDYTEWHYIDLHDKQATTTAVGEAAPGQWDFAVHRYDAKTNGRAVMESAAADFGMLTAVGTIPEEAFTADAFAQFDWNPRKRFNLIAGLRFDWFSEAKLTHLSPKIGLMYKAGNCSLRGSYAGVFRAPTLKEMYMNFYMGNIFMIYGNPDLRPESSHNFSLSAEYLKGRHNLTVTGFYNIVDDRITTAWNQALDGQVYTNMSRLQVAGVDANASGRYPCGISWRLSYAYTHEHIKKGEPMLSSTRPHAATARIAYDKEWKNYGLSVALSGRWLSKVTTDVYTELTSYEETERQTYPGYTIWKLSLTQRVWRGMNITLAVDNLFNYRPDYYYGNSPSTTGTACSVGVSLDLERMFKKK